MTPSDVKIVADNIDDFIELPNGIERLRKAVLTLAVSGKLVIQDPQDGTADTLVARIQAELIKTNKGAIGRKKKVNVLALVEAEETPFDIPKSWQWVRLGVVTNYGRTEKIKGGKIENGMWILELEDLEKDGGRLLSVVEYPQRRPQSDKNIFKKGDVLYGKLRPYLNKVIVAERDGIASSELLPIRWYGQGSPEYLRLVMLSEYFSEHVNKRVYGMKMPRLGTEDGQNAPIPLPPLSEQIRIVKKAEELMHQINQLEIKKLERDEVRTRLARSAMQSLSRGESRIAFENLVELIKTPADLKELESALLTLAMSGKLVTQNSSDEQISLLLKRIDSARINTAENDHRADKELQSLLVPELRSEIPPTWAWRGLADIALFIDYRGKTPIKTDSGVRLITAKNVRQGHVRLDPQEFISEKTYKDWMTRGFPEMGDVLFTTEAPMGNAAVVDIEENFGLAQRVINLRPYGGIDGSFLMLQLSSGLFQMMLDKTASGMTAKGIKASKLKRLPIAVPPLAEQKRIVKKVGEVMVLINHLKQVIG